MNERIEKLIVEMEPDAFMTYKGYLYHAYDPKVSEHSDPEPLYTRQELEKFAGLIIRECVDIADDYVKDYLVEEHIKCNRPRSKIGLMIKQHFGVEEK
jgi:hypothetical protein